MSVVSLGSNSNTSDFQLIVAGLSLGRDNNHSEIIHNIPTTVQTSVGVVGVS